MAYLTVGVNDLTALEKFILKVERVSGQCPGVGKTRRDLERQGRH